MIQININLRDGVRKSNIIDMRNLGTYTDQFGAGVISHRAPGIILQAGSIIIVMKDAKGLEAVLIRELTNIKEIIISKKENLRKGTRIIVTLTIKVMKIEVIIIGIMSTDTNETNTLLTFPM